MTREDELKTILESTPVAFGLQQQGHIPIIEIMLSEGKSWHEIGKAIWWCPDTAKRHYEMHKAKGQS